MGELLRQITLDEDKPIPVLKGKDRDLYNLLEFTQEEQEYERDADDPYKNPDNPKNVARYLDRFLRALSGDITGFIDSIKFIGPVEREILSAQNPDFDDNKLSQINIS